MIIALAGLSKSGKSLLAKHLAKQLDWPVLGFGDYVRYVATTRDLGTEVSTLQKLGQSMVENDPNAFIKAVFEHGNLSPIADVILDGMRHVEVLAALETYVAPESVKLILVQVNHEELARRHESVGQDLTAVLAGATEQQVQAGLAGKAALIVDGSGPVDAAFSDISKLIKRG